MLYGMARLLLLLEGLFALGVWFFSYDSPSLAETLTGKYLGNIISHVTVMQLFLGGAAIVVVTAILIRLSRTITGQILVVAAYLVNIYFAFVSDLKLIATPAFFEVTFVGGFICAFLVLTAVAREKKVSWD